jgi:hypothetical protein
VLFIGFAFFYVIVSMPTPIDGSSDSAGVIFGNPRCRVNWLSASASHRAAKGAKNVPKGFLEIPAVFESIFDGITDVFVFVPGQLIALHSTR